MTRTEDIQRRVFIGWTDEEIAFICDAWGEGLKLREISAQIVAVSGFRRSSSAIGGKVSRLGLPRRAYYLRCDKGTRHELSRIERTEPSTEAWMAAATLAANEAGVRPSELVGPSKRKSLGPPRWRAWRSVLDSYPHVSIAGLSRVSGFHHVSIIYGLGRLREQQSEPVDNFLLANEIRQA